MNEQIDDHFFEHIWKQGKRKRAALKTGKWVEEIFPKSLNKLLKVAEAFGKIKLNDRDLPF